MARRGRRNSRKNTLPLLMVVVLVAMVLLQSLFRFASDHPLTVFVLAMVALGAAIIVIILLVRARRERGLRQAELDRNVAATDGMTGQQFEQYIARLMRRDGLHHVEVCGGSGDLGADVRAYTPDGRRVVVQCKRYSKSLGDPHVQKFNGTPWQIHGADVAVLVTTGRPTNNARQLAQRCGIVLVDRDALAVWATDGVPPVPGWPQIGASPSGPTIGQVPFVPRTP